MGEKRERQSYKLTDAFIRDLELPDHGYRIWYDSDVGGFGIRGTAKGAKSFILTYWNAEGRQPRYTIGSFPDWSTTAARKEARELRKRVDRGEDPQRDKKDIRDAPTIKDMCEKFLAEYAPKKRPSTQASYRGQIESVILPELGSRKVVGLTHNDIEKFHDKLSSTPTRRKRGGTPIKANRVVALLSRMLSLSIKWGWRTDNPVKGVERNPEAKRERYLTPDELPRLLAALDQLRDQQAADIIRLLLLTGARRGETLQAKWADINLDTGVWTKPGSTTNQRTSHRVPLSGVAKELLLRLRAAAHPDDEYVFQVNGSHRRDVREAWERVCKLAKLQGIRLHDLRHSYASMLVSSGLSLPVIGALLGHTQPSTTQRYAHLFDDPLRAATERVADVVAGAKS